MSSAVRRSSALKPEFDAPDYRGRREPGATADERRVALVTRVHDAVLTAAVMRADGPVDRMTFWPEHPREFADRVGEEEPVAPRPRWRPTPAMVDDMLPALQLLEGLRPDYYGVVYLRALFEFFDRQRRTARPFHATPSEAERAMWEAIADRFGRRWAWAKDIYERAMVQAARADGLLPKVPDDYAVVGISAMTGEGLFMTYVTAVAKPRQTLSDVRAKSPLDIVDAFALWVPGKPVAKRIVDEFRAGNGAQRWRGSWVQLNPFDVELDLAARVGVLGADWRLEYIEVAGERVTTEPACT